MKHRLGNIRIIGGCWRRRLIPVPEAEGLSPTQDRVRETVFNWLAPSIMGASCLDLFAGSGALGFEALSRGAQRTTFVDKNAAVIRHLKKMLRVFSVPTAQAEIVHGAFLEKVQCFAFSPYDIVFLDPPFCQENLSEILSWLACSCYLAASALVYLETKRGSVFEMPVDWRCLKEGNTRHVSYYLFQS